MSLTEEDHAKINEPYTVNKRVALRKSQPHRLKLQNKDVYGYIKIPGTKVDDIIVQAEDNDYYLNHSWKGDYLPNGAIFRRLSLSQKRPENYNTILYGHHTTDGSMFNTLDYFFNEEFFKTTNTSRYTHLTVSSLTRFSRCISPICTISTSAPHFTSGKDFVDFACEMKSNSIYEREGIEFAENDRIITLSTGTNRSQNERIGGSGKAREN